MAQTKEQTKWEKWVEWYPDSVDNPPKGGVKRIKKDAPEWARKEAEQYIKDAEEGIDD